MSNPYSPIILPDVLSVRCPSCDAHAQFEYASYVPIPERKFIDYFKASDHFTYVDKKGLDFGKPGVIARYHSTPHAAVYFHGLNGNTLHAIDDLPEPFETKHWERPMPGTPDRMYRYYDHGTVSCLGCSLRRKHELAWPDDAWFQISHRGQTLWAFNRESASVLRDFVGADDRSLRNFTHNKFLLKIPAHFLEAKAREPVTKKLNALLGAS